MEPRPPPDPAGPSRRARVVLAIALATAVGGGAALRFGGLERTSPFLWDDAIHHLEAVFLVDVVRFLGASVERKAEERRTGEDRWTWGGERERFAGEVGGITPRHARPGHTLLVALALGTLGPVPWAGPFVSAACGTATLIVLFLVVRRWGGPHGAWIGVLATTWLAVDPTHVRLSREGLADADGLLFALVALAAYLGSREPARDGGPRPGRILLAGLAAGLAFTVQTRNFLVPLLVLGWELAPGPWRLERPGPDRRRRIALYLGGAAAIPAACEIPYYLALLAGRPHGIVPPLQSYVLQVLRVFGRHAGAGAYVEISTLANLASYPWLSRAVHGSWLPLAVVTGGLATVLRAGLRGGAREPEVWFPASWLLATGLFLSLTAPFARYAAFFLPASAWLAAAGLVAAVGPVLTAGRGQGGPGSLSSRSLAGAWTLAFLVSVGLSTGAARSAARDVRPGYADAVEWMRDRGGVWHVSTQPYVGQVLAGVREVAEVPGNAGELETLVTRGHRYLLVDLIRNFFLGPAAPRGALLASVTERCDPAATFENRWAERPEYLAEFNYDLPTTLDRWTHRTRDRYGVIEVYDLERCPWRTGTVEVPADAAPSNEGTPS